MGILRGLAIALLYGFFYLHSGTSLPCVLKELGHEKRVCVCNSTYCDTLERIALLRKDEYAVYISSKEGLRFNKTVKQFYGTRNHLNRSTEFSNHDDDTIIFETLFVDPSKKYQKIEGFGGAFTDATGINLRSLSTKTRKKLLSSYFSKRGLEYNLCRVPIGGTDFSPRKYSYDDGKPDPELKNFSLPEEDLQLKIPFIQAAMKMSRRKIHLVAASWSPPPWMKSNNKFTGFTMLKAEYYDVYTHYLLRFLDHYKLHGVDIWALSTGNEPSDGIIPILGINSLGWTPFQMAHWVANFFGPQLRNSTHNTVKILTLDDQRIFVPWWVDWMVRTNKNVLQYIDGFGIHWYEDFFIPKWGVTDLHEKYPDKFILYTEACQGAKPWDQRVDIGSWDRGEGYIRNIIENTNNWATGWLDWNMALDLTGGPTWDKKFHVDSPILVNSTADEFYKQPMYYAMGHVSKFIERDAVRIEVSPNDSQGLRVMAVENPDDVIVIVMVNKNDVQMVISIFVSNKGWLTVDIPPRSFTTIVC